MTADEFLALDETAERYELIDGVVVMSASASGPHSEIVSPGNRGQDLVTKRHDYNRLGVGEYWIIDPEQGDVYASSAARARRSVCRGAGRRR